MRPVLFYLPFHLPIYSYGVMLALSLVLGWYLTLGFARRDGMDREVMGSCYIFTAVSAILGARLLYVLTNVPREGTLLDLFVALFRVNQGGLVAYGGILGGFLGSAIFCALQRVRLLAWADCVVPSLSAGVMVTRIGCLLAGCDFGKPWDGPLAIHFPAGSPAFHQQRTAGLLGSAATSSLAVHPTQLYESFIGLALFGAVMLVRRHRQFSGQMFLAFTMGYAVLRYFVEALRADEQRGAIGHFSTSQFIAIVTFAAGLLLLAWQIAQWRRDPQAVRLWENGMARLPAADPPPRPSNRPSTRHLN